jgi:hypothetical protein
MAKVLQLFFYVCYRDIAPTYMRILAMLGELGKKKSEIYCGETLQKDVALLK